MNFVAIPTSDLLPGSLPPFLLRLFATLADNANVAPRRPLLYYHVWKIQISKSKAEINLVTEKRTVH